jgi:predicted amidophosphoribosyltransferase
VRFSFVPSPSGGRRAIRERDEIRARLRLLELLLPQRCVVCGAGGAQLCARCRERLPRIVAPVCARCGAPTAWPVARCAECVGRRLAFASARAAVEYDDAVRALVSAWKDRGLRRLAGEAAELVAETLQCPDVDALTFVPPDGDRSVKRGHHPAESLARGLAQKWQLPDVPLLARTREVRPQRGLPLVERRRNVRGAFRARRRSPAAVALVDDVYTSGATVAAAASALRAAGARRVEVVTFARVVR